MANRLAQAIARRLIALGYRLLWLTGMHPLDVALALRNHLNEELPKGGIDAEHEFWRRDREP